MRTEEFIEFVEDNYLGVSAKKSALGVVCYFREECSDGRIFATNRHFATLEIVMAYHPEEIFGRTIERIQETLQDSVDAHEASLGD